MPPDGWNYGVSGGGAEYVKALTRCSETAPAINRDVQAGLHRLASLGGLTIPMAG